MYELSISDNYPNNYWFEYHHPDILGTDFVQCKKINYDDDSSFVFILKKKVSEKKLFFYDFYFSNGPIFISPRLASLFSDKPVLDDMQLVDASIIVNEVKYHGYKIINITRTLSCIDIEKSDSQPLLSYLPDGPKKFNKIVFKENVTEQFNIARCQEHKSCIVMSEQLRKFMVDNHVKGIDLL